MRQTQKLLGSLATGLVLSIAVALLWFVVVIIAVQLLGVIVNGQWRYSDFYSYEQLKMTGDGSPVVQVRSYRMSLSGYDYSYLNADRTQFQGAGHPALLAPADMPSRADRGLIGQSVSLVTRALRVNAAQEPGPLLPELWYFVSDGRPISYGWFEGYDVVTKRRIGYIGNQGFRQQPLSSSEQFRVVGIGLQFYPSTVLLTNNDVQRARSWDTARSPIVYDDSAPIDNAQVVLLNESGVSLIDFRQRTATTLLNDPTAVCLAIVGIPSILAADPQAREGAKPARMQLRNDLAIRTADRIHLLHPPTGEHREWILPEVEREVQLGVYPLLGNAMAVSSRISGTRRNIRPGYQSVDQRVVVFDTDVNEIRQADVSVVNRANPWMTGIPSFDASVIAAGVPAPIYSAGAVAIVGLSAQPDEDSPEMLHSLSAFLSHAWPALFAVFVLGCVCCWWADRYATRHRVPRSIPWLIFVFLFGVPGLIGFWLHRHWPVEKRVPAPAPRGIEVWA